MEYNKPRKNMKSRWSVKYKKSIDCNNPKGFSQKNYCKRQKRGGKYKSFYEWLIVEKDFLISEDSHTKLYREVVKKLKDAGFTFIRRDSNMHDIWEKDGTKVTVITNVRSNPKILFNQTLRAWEKTKNKNLELQTSRPTL